jgi:protein-L-isoaspartate(D-aspartate) O-methyltransferase
MRYGCRAAFGLFGLALVLTARAQDDESFRAARLRMVEVDIAREGITNKAVLDAMREVPRHRLVDPSLQGKAYFDQSMPIGHKQTISPPFIVAYMTQSIDPQPTDRVLEIGTGSGYQAAILSRIVKEVYTIEIVEPLGKQAAERLKELGYSNVHVRVGDGYKGWPEAAPFDKILVTCSPEDVPKPLVEQLREGGKMIIPLGQRHQQIFYLFEKRQGKLVKTKLIPTLFVPMTGQSEEQRKVKPDPRHPRLLNGGFEFDSDGLPENWFYLRQAKVVRDGGAPEGKAHLSFSNSDPGRIAQALQGIAVDGEHVRSLQVSLMVKLENAKPGPLAHEQPAFLIFFYDAERQPLGEHFLGPWKGSFKWRRVTGELPVPEKTQEAIVRVGLNGATGRMGVDDIQLMPRPRQ